MATSKDLLLSILAMDAPTIEVMTKALLAWADLDRKSVPRKYSLLLRRNTLPPASSPLHMTHPTAQSSPIAARTNSLATTTSVVTSSMAG